MAIFWEPQQSQSSAFIPCLCVSRAKRLLIAPAQGGEIFIGEPVTNRWKCFAVSLVKLLFKFTNKIGENTGESPLKLFHRSLVNRQCGEFPQFPTLLPPLKRTETGERETMAQVCACTFHCTFNYHHSRISETKKLNSKYELQSLSDIVTNLGQRQNSHKIQ